MNRILVFLIILGCARVGYPPGKPETIPPKIEIDYPQKFNAFPFNIKINIKDNTKIKTFKFYANDLKLLEKNLETQETTLNISIDTLQNFSDTIATYNFTFQALDIYDNISNKQIVIYYKKEENPPLIQILDTNFKILPYKILLNLKDDTRLKSLTIFKSNNILKSFSLFSRDTTFEINIDSSGLLILKAQDIYLNSQELRFAIP
ncbi:MAG: hypothetical protein ABIL37_02865 [candidate division WOR-3 bacterium]